MNADKFLEQLNISKDDYAHIKKKMKREPKELELWLFSAMYSEHCGYRHSKKYLEKLPRKNAIYFNENAGGVKIGEHAILFKMESHNHPSAVEPFNGAATGIGGIIRDVLAMNARPIALVDSLKFGNLEDNKTKYIFEGVVDGISSYGNCIGVPTLAGECDFDEGYTDNPLVNVMALGITKYDEIKTSKASKNKVILLLGSATMKDGIGGASFASKDLNEENEENRISVQIADPLMEKKVIEATLEILGKNLASSCQDCGAAGILSSTSEMASDGNCGIELYLDQVHTAQKNMLPFEIMLSETQERMMFCVEVKHLEQIKKISQKYEIPYSIIGKTIKEKNYKLFWGEKEIACVCPALLADAPFVKVKPSKYKVNKIIIEKKEITEKNIYDFVKNPSFASKDYIYSQYDYTVGARTSIVPRDKGIGAIWLHEENCFLGISTESKPHQVNADPLNGTANTVADAAGKLIAAGFKPLGITNCMNFANPNEPETMMQFTQSLKGMKKALKKLKIPVCSGNVSFYNKTENYIVPPTPTVSMIGVCRDYEKIIDNQFKDGETLVLIGKSSSINYGGLFYGSYSAGKTDYKLEKKLKNTLKKLNEKNLINACLRVTKGGVFGAIFKGLAPQRAGFKMDCKMDTEELFSENQGRYIFSTNNAQAALKYLKHIPHKILGNVNGNAEKIELSQFSLEKERLFDEYHNSIKNALT